ncbi:MAG: hypothetical protein MJK18_05985, partial [Bdellovibrionales bacterium]|nr:hypothetical protein [Bdellovibrionales bacterium]
AEQSGRSFGVVHDTAIEANNLVDYIADASYYFYLNELEDVLEDREQAFIFYNAVFSFLIKSDTSAFNNPEMERNTKRVAADFVAVYVAEQYRRLLKYDGEFVNYPWETWRRRKPWDDAHLQTTILANFHAGQDSEIRGMYFAGRYMTRTYRQKDKVNGVDICAYELLTNDTPEDNFLVESVRRRSFRLNDYWQFGLTCGGRSGVNITRSDFVKMGRTLTSWLNRNGQEEALNTIWETSERNFGTRQNVIDKFAAKLIDDEAPTEFQDPDALIEALVNFTMLIRDNANEITRDRLL